MENFLDELNLQRRATIQNIEKSFGIDIEKSRSGVYSDTAENRKLNRVGQSYGSKKKQDEEHNAAMKEMGKDDLSYKISKMKRDIYLLRKNNRNHTAGKLEKELERLEKELKGKK